MIKVRLTTFCRTDDSLLKRLINQFNLLKDFKYELTTKNDYDILIVFNNPYQDHDVTMSDQSNILTARTEPDEFNQLFKYKSFNHSKYVGNLIQAHFNDNPSQVYRMDKIVSVLSAMRVFKHHHIRRDFNLFIDRTQQIACDFYGKPSPNDHFKEFSHHRGFIPDKIKLLENYRYNLVIENAISDNYFSEKLIESVCAGCFSLYEGYQHISDIVDPQCFIRIDTHNYIESLETIIETMRLDYFNQNQDILIQEGIRLREKFSIGNQLNVIIDQHLQGAYA